METLDEERLIAILETSADIVLGKKQMSSLVSTLMDIDEHVRTALLTNLVSVFRRGMALNLDLEAFDVEIEKLFAHAKLLSRALHMYWRKNSESLCRQYELLCPLDNRLIDLKWVAVLPSSSKYGLTDTSASVQCQFTTTSDKFAMTLTPSGVNNLAEEIGAIQAALQELK